MPKLTAKLLKVPIFFVRYLIYWVKYGPTNGIFYFQLSTIQCCQDIYLK